MENERKNKTYKYFVNSHSNYMKKHVLKSSFLAGLCSLMLAFSSWREGKVTEITKPYLGEYECKQAILGEIDCLKKFDYIRLELSADNQFKLSYCETKGKKQTIKGTYEYEEESQSVCLKMGVGGIVHRKFPLRDGVLYITIPFKLKSLALQFEQK